MKIKVIEKEFKGSITIVVASREFLTMEFFKALIFDRDIIIEKFNTTIVKKSTLDLGGAYKK